MPSSNPPLQVTQNVQVSKRAKLSVFKDKAKSKAKHALHIDSSNEDDEDPTPYQEAMEELNSSPAFNSSKFLDKARMGPRGMPDKTIAVLQATAEAIIHPKAAIKSRATKKTAGKLAKSHPYLSRKADLDFLEAHDDLKRAQDSRGGSDDEETMKRKDGDIEGCEDQVQDMERNRLGMRVAWVTARHVQRVRVVEPRPTVPFPDDSFFEEQDEFGFVKFNWGKWLAYKLLFNTHSFTAQYIDDFDELPFSSDTLRRHIERFIIVSAPLQAFLSDIRQVYRWEDPYRTGKWLATYILLWYLGHMMTFLYGQIVYSTIMNYYYPTSLESLREEIQRSMDRGATALKIGELMDRHGCDDWLRPLLDELGPILQVQIADFASLLKASYNFYHFRSPRATIASLFLFSTLCLLNLFVDAAFGLRFFWSIIGLIFFVCWPISSLYPRYRLLVSPFRWSIWDVPNHAEWCFQYLQERASIAREAIVNSSSPHDGNYIRIGLPPPRQIIANNNLHSQIPEDDEDDTSSFTTAHGHPSEQEELDILSFSCTYLHTPGRLILSTHSLRFISSIPIPPSILPYESFNYPYSSLIEMSKRQTRSSILSPLAKVTTGMDKLEVWFKEGRERGDREGEKMVVLENMRGRDKAFNAILGFSGLRWQHLQREGEKRVLVPRAR